MPQNANQQRLLSHAIAPETVDAFIQKFSEKIKHSGDQPHVTIERQLELLKQLSEFDFGRFLLQNQGINGYWTHYMLTYPWFKPNVPPLERYMLERAPVIVATQQRFGIFLKENQKQVKNGAKLACIPCGMMGELLYLNFKGMDDIELIGIDYDAHTLLDAQALAEKQKLMKWTALLQGDAWQLKQKNEFDLISSNGLNIYEPDDDKVTALYDQFYQALKPEGKLVTSFLTPPPALTPHCEWDMNQINRDDLLLQKIIFADIIGAKWQCFRSSEQTRAQLMSVGFKNIEMIYDNAKIFPTVCAYK